MTKETIALHGKKDLLQQARKDLVAAGFEDDKRWNDNDDFHFNSTIISEYLFLNGEIGLEYHNHNCNATTVIDLTPENYEHVINLIITKKDELQAQ